MRLGGTFGELYPMIVNPLSARSGPQNFFVEVGNGVPDRRKSVLVGSTATLAIATIFIAARLVSRVIIVRRTAWDDYFIILAWFIACGLTISAAIGTANGLGLHDVDIPAHWVYPLRKCEYAFSVLYNPALMATKSSMIIFYLRLSRNTHEWLRAASWITLGVTNIAGLVLTFFNIFQCIPVSQVFEPSGKCIPLIELYLASVPVNVITDLAVLVLPIPVLTGIQLPRKQKTILVATFGLGLYVVATDIVRIYYLQQSSSGYWGASDSATSPLLGNEADFAWFASLSFLWSAIEVNMGLICASIPTLKPLISRLWPTLIDNKRWSSCFWASKGSASSTTVVSSPRPGEVNGRMQNMQLPIARPRPVFSTNSDTLVSSRRRFSAFQPQQPLNSDTLVSSRGRFSSFDPTETIRSLPPTTGENGDAEMEMLEFVTSPGMDLENIPRVSTTTTRTQADVYFGFLSIKRPRSMLRSTFRDSIKYYFMVGILFFLCGFSHGLWNNLNNQINRVSRNSMARTLGLYSTYYGAYFFGPTTAGQFVLRTGGFKATFIAGLCLYGTGVFMYWPSAVLLSYPGFMISNFFVGFGLSIVDMSTDAFLTLCGPQYYGEIRLLIGRGVESIGKVVGMLLAAKGLFQNVENGPALLHIQWIYLGVSLCSVVLALAFYYLPLPEATDDELEQARQLGYPQLNGTIFAPPEERFWLGNCTVVSMTLTLGFCAQFLSSGVLLGNGVWFSGTLACALNAPANPRIGSFDFMLVADSAAAFGRFFFAAFCFFIPPRILLLLSFLSAVLFTTFIFAITSLSRNSIAAFLSVLYFFEGPIWPLIFAICLRGLGRRTKKAIGLLTSAQGSASIVPWLMYAIIKGGGKTAKYSYCLLLAFLALGMVFPVYLSAFPVVKKQVNRGDKKAASDIFESPRWPRSHESTGNQRTRGTNPASMGSVLQSRIISEAGENELS